MTITNFFTNAQEKLYSKYNKIENNYFIKFSIRKTLFIATIIFFAAAMYILNCLTPLIADDYAWGYISGTGTRIENLKDILLSMYNFYFNWRGRIGGEFYNQLFTLAGKPIFNIFNTIIYIINTLLIYHICIETKKIKVSLYIGINLLLWFFVQDYGQVMFWISGACNYLWAITPILIIILIFRKYSINQEVIKNNLINTFIICIVGILAGWSSENGSAGMLVILTLYLVYYYFNNIKISTYIISGYIGSLIGYALLIGAPGNFVRKAVEQSAVNTSIIFRIFMITYFWVAYLFVIFIILSIVFFIGKRYFDLKKNNSIYQAAIFIIASLGAAYCMIASPISPERTWFSVVVFLIISIGILYDKFDFKAVNVDKNTILMLRRLVLAVIIFASCNFIVMYLDTTISTYEIMVQTNQRKQYILNEKAKGNLDVSVPIISHKYPLLAGHDAMHGLSDITTDPNHYANKAVCNYYGINSITGIPAKEKQYLNN
ncbi:hypothetical protein CLPUN_17150 [Clostridium puniceum]|uniref:Uncharacterized protein n=2 Tax=Clostridium puniceum TaxID=29367 RepID=A0A1S8TMJ4_9CLOT|nr:hypothetical protein CLPUN_17150 [Clostridium puniceum]